MAQKNDTADNPPTQVASDLAFEPALDELESLVQKLETGELSLADSLAAFERGVALTRHCQKALEAAQLKVQTLTRTDDGWTLTDTDTPPDADPP